ncbi:MAG: hypothetical protein ABFS56_33765 [Pseudomonadota bacterium]
MENYPNDFSDLMVEINDPRRLSRAEHEAILARCRLANMAIYDRSKFQNYYPVCYIPA